jgi:hypothetical protein
MSIAVYANGMSIACKAASGKSVAATPDVCLSPPSPPAGPIPVPYPNTAMASDTTDGSKSVQIGGQEVMLKDKSTFKTSSGNEAATKSLGMGVVTHQIQGKLNFVAWSMDVKFEEANVPRHMDITGHNEGSVPANTPTWPYLDQQTMASDDPCRRDAAKVSLSCSGDPEKDCPAPGSDFAANPCVKAKRCMLSPYRPSKCCDDPKQTPHHLVPKRGFKAISQYNADKAPCVCAEGSSWHRSSTVFSADDQTHADLHDIQDTFERQMIDNSPAGSQLNYGQAKSAGIAAHSEVFKESGCDPACIEKQLDNYHKGECGISESTPMSQGPIRELSTLVDKAKKALFDAGTRIYQAISKAASEAAPTSTSF